MSDLRLIILSLGLAIIAGIYLWETVKQRQLQRRQTVRYSSVDHEISDLKLSARQAEEEDFSSAISDLNNFLAASKQHMAETIADRLTMQIQENVTAGSDAHRFAINKAGEAVVSPDIQTGDNRCKERDIAAGNHAVTSDELIINVFIRAPGGTVFNSKTIFDAAGKIGMEYGDMDIFHHYGMAQIRTEQPLFSLADMFEPGNFPEQDSTDRVTDGLVLFSCLPGPVAGLIILELMLETAVKLAELLGGTVLGPEQKQLDDRQITALRELIREHEFAG
jgi:cell division protein ZipA